MKLRPYQSAAIEAARGAVVAGHRAICLVAPTGAGKTAIASEIARGALARGSRVLWLAHRVELVEQAATTLLKFGLSAGVISASSEQQLSPLDPLQVASIQTLQARQCWPRANLVIVDECHHASADAFSTSLAIYADALRVGVTACPQGRNLAGVFSTLIEVAKISELIRGGFLVPCHVMAPNAPLRPGTIASRPVDAYLKHTPGASAIVYAPNLLSARTFTADFLSAGVHAEMIDGSTDAGIRRETLEFFKNGELPVIVNVGCLTEGTDLPRCSCVIIARACDTLGLYLQICGRALRPFPGKERATVIDLRGASHQHGHPTEDRTYTLEGFHSKANDGGSDQAYCRICAAPIMPGTGCDDCGTEAASAQPLRVVHAPLKTYGHLKNPDTAAKTLATLVQRYGHGRGRAIYRSMMSKANA
jgi:DNA repair protein RadD